MSDGMYDPLIFESLLKSTFGVARRLFGTAGGQASGSKVAVITASISDDLFILSNYNGTSPGQIYPSEQFSSAILRPENISDEPYIWEA